jgi:squalene-hopene/tetraprenyl-beta-curcumene cyclase
MRTIIALALCALAITSSHAEQELLPADPAKLSLRNEVERAITRGLDWLGKQQQADGSWSTADHPAVTGLVLTAYFRDPAHAAKEERSALTAKGVDFLLKAVQPDGSISRGQLVNYNTSISMMALMASRDAGHAKTIAAARQFLVKEQSDFGEKGKYDTVWDGGIGYGTHGPQSDLSNTLMALEAIRTSQGYIQVSEKGSDLNWENAIAFIQACQNLPEHNKEPWASDDPKNRGGFIYQPGKSMAGEMKLENGRTALRSYGSMTYAGLLSYIYADLKKEDSRVQAALDWLRANYTLSENPGMGQEGLFYYFHTMSKALTAAGIDELQLADGATVDWKTDLTKRLLNLQSPDGSWVNSNGRWWEKDPVLVTAYSILALEQIYSAM